MKTDQEQLDKASAHYYYTERMSVDNRLRRFMIKKCLPYSKGPNVLELGFMDGQWTEEFLNIGYKIDIVEGAARQWEVANRLYKRNKAVRVFHSLFEDFVPDTKYNTILAGGMIKHLPDPKNFLINIKNWLSTDGILIATTPNGGSFHRRVGTYMGILSEPMELTYTDRQVANLRVYNRYTFRKELEQGGWKVKILKGAVLKPVSTDLMTHWSDELLEALDQMGEELQDYCWYIYAICEPSQEISEAKRAIK